MQAILVGGFMEMVELCELCNIEIKGIIDNTLQSTFAGYPILGKDEDAPSILNRFPALPVVVTPDSPALRKKLVSYYSSVGFDFISVVSPKAEVSRSSNLGKGVVVQSGVNISADAVIGDFVKLNTGANIMHDSVVGNYTTVAPNAVVLGRVTVGCDCYVGANATVLPEVVIGDAVVVGAGAVVAKDVEDGKTVKGVPAK